MKNILFTTGNPATATTITGKMAENFKKNDELLLVDCLSHACHFKVVERVVDAGDGNCVLDLI